MYARRFSHNFVPTGSPNLKCLVPERCCENISDYTLTVKRQFSECRNIKDLKTKLETAFLKAKLYKRVLFSKQSPENTLKVWAQQFEFVFAQRVRRGQQMFCLYSKWWEEKALREFLKNLRGSFSKNGREFIMGALGVSSLYNWEEKRIGDDEFQSHLDDLTYVEALKEATMCLSCAAGESSNKNTRICQCGTGGVTNKSYDSWVPFIEKDDLIVWRRPHGEGLFEYKVYGSYYDVSAEDFLNVQVDTDYRKQWDTTAVQLEIGEKDPNPEGNSDILYWEMQWPRLFVNRDYVFNRRYRVFEDTKTIIIINKTTEYPRFPKYPDKFRVEEYWSAMVIKPYKIMNEPGIEFSLTYFDNPGVNIPSSVTTWVAKSAMPDYLSKLRFASRNYKEYCINKGTSKACEIYQKEEKARREEEERNKLEYCSNERLTVMLSDIFEDIQRKANEKFRKSEIFYSGSLENRDKTPPISEDVQQSQSASNNPKQGDNTFWKYLHPMYYFT